MLEIGVLVQSYHSLGEKGGDLEHAHSNPPCVCVFFPCFWQLGEPVSITVKTFNHKKNQLSESCAGPVLCPNTTDSAMRIEAAPKLLNCTSKLFQTSVLVFELSRV